MPEDCCSLSSAPREQEFCLRLSACFSYAFSYSSLCSYFYCSCSVSSHLQGSSLRMHRLQAKIHSRSVPAGGIFAFQLMFYYGQRSKFADLLNSYHYFTISSLFYTYDFFLLRKPGIRLRRLYLLMMILPAFRIEFSSQDPSQPLCRLCHVSHIVPGRSFIWKHWKFYSQSGHALTDSLCSALCQRSSKYISE